MTHIEPRRIVRVDSTAILEWQRMVYRDFGNKKGMLRGSDRDVTRGALHLAIGVALSVNGLTHQARLGVNTYAKRVAYVGGGHNLHGQLPHLLELGFLTQKGKLGNGAPILYLSVPCALMAELAAVKKNGFLALLDALGPEVITVPDTEDVGQRIPDYADPNPTDLADTEPDDYPDSPNTTVANRSNHTAYVPTWARDEG